MVVKLADKDLDTACAEVLREHLAEIVLVDRCRREKAIAGFVAFTEPERRGQEEPVGAN